MASSSAIFLISGFIAICDSIGMMRPIGQWSYLDDIMITSDIKVDGSFRITWFM